MTILEKEFALADAVENTDLLKGATWINKKVRKRVVAIGVVGSAAVDDTRLGIVYGSVKMGEILNNSTGLTLDTDRDLKPCPSSMVANSDEDIGLVVEKAPATNPIKICLIIEELP
jgi:hypothetical protein